jgi:thiosulfate/3-mercaptopyruvate sulfurtransferase
MSNSVAEPVRSAATKPLVASEWLADRLSEPDLLVLDIRSVVDGGGRQAYEAGHIPGAIHTDYVNDGWRVTKGMASGLLPDPAALADLLSRIGLTPRQHAIIVSAGTTAGDFSAAARVYWTLKIAGHDKTSILSGGMLAWGRDATRPIEAGPASVNPPSPPYPIKLRCCSTAAPPTFSKGARNPRKPCGQGGFPARCSSIMSWPSIPP